MNQLNESRADVGRSHEGQWHRRGRAIVLDDPFAVDSSQAENGFGGGTPPPRRSAPKSPSPDQLALLRTFFGADEAGARYRLAHFSVPTGLTAGTLRWYIGVARRVLADPAKATVKARVVQPLRLQLVARALAALGTP